jgi:HK97 gp10 family phage protein
MKLKFKAKVITPKLTKLQRELKNLNKRAMRRGVKLVLAAVRTSAPVASGALRKSLTSKVDSIKGSTSAYGIVGPKSAFKIMFRGKPKQPSRYAHFIERGKYARPFLLPAWQTNKARFLSEVARATAEGMGQALR